MSIITVIGSLNYDLVTYTDVVPNGGETVQARSFERHLGGKGLNEAIAAARLVGNNSGVKVRMIGNVGADVFGNELVDALKDSGVDVDNVGILEQQQSGTAVIIVESNGENRILINAGANGLLRPTDEDYEHFFPIGEDGNHIVMLQNEYPDTVKTIDWLYANRPEVRIAYNPSPYNAAILNSSLLTKLDLIIVNESEAIDLVNSLFSEEITETITEHIKKDLISGSKELAVRLRSTLKQEGLRLAIITLGSKGSVYASGEMKSEYVEAVKIDQIVDTTGAGDTFFGGVVSKLIKSEDITSAIKFATKASSLVIQKHGAAESIPTLKSLQKN